MSDFKNRLSILRKLKQLSQAELAEKIGVHTNIISRYERDLAKPSMELASKLSEVLEVSLDYLVGKVDQELDKEIVEQVLTLQQLPKKEKEHILFTLNALIRDAKSRFAYT
jgi:transcriptional regulator with XRE-family HTH domain